MVTKRKLSELSLRALTKPLAEALVPRDEDLSQAEVTWVDGVEHTHPVAHGQVAEAGLRVARWVAFEARAFEFLTRDRLGGLELFDETAPNTTEPHLTGRTDALLRDKAIALTVFVREPQEVAIFAALRFGFAACVVFASAAPLIAESVRAFGGRQVGRLRQLARGLVAISFTHRNFAITIESDATPECCEASVEEVRLTISKAERKVFAGLGKQRLCFWDVAGVYGLCGGAFAKTAVHVRLRFVAHAPCLSGTTDEQKNYREGSHPRTLVRDSGVASRGVDTCDSRAI